MEKRGSSNLYHAAQLVQKQAQDTLENAVARDAILSVELEVARDLIADALARVNRELLRRDDIRRQR